MSSQTLAMTPSIYRYYTTHGFRTHPLLAALSQETQQLQANGMQICSEQGALMQLLVKWGKAKRCLEVGTFTGYSALSMALVLPEDGELIACDINQEWTDIAQRYWQAAGVAHKISLRLAPALMTLQQLVEQGQQDSFDFIFIDADKANYSAYYELAVQLARPGGMIAVDNVLWYGRVADEADTSKQTSSIRQINQKILTDTRVEMCMLPIGDGLTLAIKKEVNS
jgi:predicted O-methyltransferase YrrM